jgi:hypothetical protein
MDTREDNNNAEVRLAITISLIQKQPPKKKKIQALNLKYPNAA